MKTILGLSITLLLTGCGGKPDLTDDFSQLGDEKSDSFSSKLKLGGSLRYGESATVRYTKTPIYRGYKFTAQAGDTVDIHVTSTVGDPVTWLLSSTYAIVAKNDDADATTANSHITKALTVSGNYYIVFRDYDYATHYFTTQLDSIAP
jgi:hypothetical protein